MDKPDSVKIIIEALERQKTSQAYLSVLKTLAVVGVADTRQLEQATQLSRNQLTRLLQMMHAVTGDRCCVSTVGIIPKKC
jgi:hypothetical protein